MENKPLKFNKPFTSDQVIAENSLQNRLKDADPISKNIGDAEVGVHIYRAKAAVLEKLLTQEAFSSDAVASIRKLIEIIEKKLDIYKKRKDRIILKQETQIIQEPINDGEEWKIGTEYAPTHEKVEVYAIAKPGVKESYLDKLEDDTIETTKDIQDIYEHIEEFFPEAFAKIEQAFNDMQRENRTN